MALGKVDGKSEGGGVRDIIFPWSSGTQWRQSSPTAPAEPPLASRSTSFSHFLCHFIPRSNLLVCRSAGLDIQLLVCVPAKISGLYGQRIGGVAGQSGLGKCNSWAQKQRCLFLLRPLGTGSRVEPSAGTWHFSTQHFPVPFLWTMDI